MWERRSCDTYFVGDYQVLEKRIEVVNTIRAGMRCSVVVTVDAFGRLMRRVCCCAKGRAPRPYCLSMK